MTIYKNNLYQGYPLTPPRPEKGRDSLGDWLAKTETGCTDHCDSRESQRGADIYWFIDPNARKCLTGILQVPDSGTAQFSMVIWR
jgi:hypothetical protein